MLKAMENAIKTFESPLNDEVIESTGAELNDEMMEKKTKPLIDEFLYNNDFEKAIMCVKELASPSTIHMFINSAINQVLEISSQARCAIGQLLFSLVKQNIISCEQYKKGLSNVLELAHKLPSTWKYIEDILEPMLDDNKFSLMFLKQILEPCIPSAAAGLLVSKILIRAVKKGGPNVESEVWTESNLQWTDFLGNTANVDEFIKNHDEDKAAAEVYEEFLASFDEPVKHGKLFVRRAVINAGSGEEKATVQTGKLYKPPKLVETVAKKPPDEKQETAKEKAERIDRQNKKKEKERKKSNLELFKEELRMIQEEREKRHRLKSIVKEQVKVGRPVEPPETQIRLADDYRYPSYGSYDTGDPSTTNLYLGNLNPKSIYEAKNIFLKQLEKFEENEEIIRFIDASVPEKTDPIFIRALVSAVHENAIKDKSSVFLLDTQILKNRIDILTHYIDHNADLELQTLFAIQALMNKLDHPKGILRTIFDILYDDDVITGESFKNWKQNEDPNENKGKAVALHSVRSFFIWLEESESGDFLPED